MMDDKGGLIEYSDSIQRQIHVLNSTRSFAIDSRDTERKTFWQKFADKLSISRMRKKWSQKRRVQKSGAFSELDNRPEASSSSSLSGSGPRASDAEEIRTVLFNEAPIASDANNSQSEFESNRVSTTKYTVLTFVPKSIYEQYRRVAVRGGGGWGVQCVRTCVGIRMKREKLRGRVCALGSRRPEYLLHGRGHPVPDSV